MKPLVTIERVLIWTCMCTPHKSATTLNKLAYAFFALIVFIGNAGTLVSCTVFFFNYASIDLASSLYALMNIAANTGVVYACCSIALVDRAKVRRIFGKLTAIYNNRKCIICHLIQWKRSKSQFNTNEFFILSFHFRSDRSELIPIFN